MIKPAIIAVGYNRPGSLGRLLDSIGNALYPFDDINLIISIDGGEESEECFKLAKNFKWDHGQKEIRHFSERQGLKKHMLQCGDLSEKYEAVIFLEDDNFVSRTFYYYIYDVVNHYKDHKDHEKITGFALYNFSWNGYIGMPFIPERNSYDVYFGQFDVSWGQCWTWPQWKKFKDWYEKNSGKLPQHADNIQDSILQWGEKSWSKYFAYYVVQNDLYYVMPYNSMSRNFNDVGVHTVFADSTNQVALSGASRRDYLFPDFKDAIKYDIFFERIFNSSLNINGISGNDICANFYGMKKNALGKKFLLTDRILNLRVVKSFGMRMRPVDANITYNISGDDIFLYEIDGSNIPDSESDFMTPKRREYEFQGYRLEELIRYISTKITSKRLIKILLKKLIRRALIILKINNSSPQI